VTATVSLFGAPAQVTVPDEPLVVVAEIAGLAAAAALATAVVALIYRWYVREPVPSNVARLLGLTAVAAILNTTTAFGQVLGGAEGPLSLSAVVFNTTAFLAGALAAPLGRLLGDRTAAALAVAAGAVEVDAEVGRLVQAVGGLSVVELPESSRSIGDVDGYEPVARETKRALAGRTFLFPRRLRVGDLQERLSARLRTDYEVGYVDVELEPDGTVTYLALGRHPVGLGHSLPPETAAVAVRADPPNGAGPGDVVRVWRDPPEGDPERVCLAEVRGVAEDTVTLAVGESIASTLAGGRYRLVTLPYTRSAERSFLGLLAGSDTTLSTATVERAADDDTLPATVLAVETDDTVRLATPQETFPVGATLYLLGTPEAIRRSKERVTAEESGVETTD
jgi:hypothetical protein